MKLVEYEVKRSAIYLECECGGKVEEKRKRCFGRTQIYKCDKCSKTIESKYEFPQLAYWEKKPKTKKIVEENFG